MDICKNTYETIIFVIFCIIIITLFVAFIILMLNIINYILFTVYCIGDNIKDYTSDNPDNIILGNKYKYRLLNYIKNINDNKPENNYTDRSIIKEYYDTNSSDLFIHKTIIYYNYIVKFLLIIILIIVIALLYNIFNIGIMCINDCDTTVSCGFLLKEILTNDAYIYYIIIMICIYVYVHSYVYTYFFNQKIYKELYDIYGGEDGIAGIAGEDGENKYKTTDTIVYNSINYIINNTRENDRDKQTKLSLYLNDLKNMSYSVLDLHKFDKKGATSDSTAIISIMNEGIINNNKFRVPIELENEGKINTLFKKIYKTDIKGIIEDGDKQRLLGHKIFIYLIYHHVISNNIEDPLIIHKLNNVFLNLFENLYEKYNIDNINNVKDAKDAISAISAISAIKTSEAKDTTVAAAVATTNKIEDPNDIIESFDIDIKNMFKEIRCAYTIKLLLPIGTDDKILTLKLHDNADIILKYIRLFRDKMKDSAVETDNNYMNALDELTKYNNITNPNYDISTEGKEDKLYVLKKTIKDNIDSFAKGFSEYYQDDKTLAVINRIVYKINFYLALEMMETVLYILIVLLILSKSGKYPYIEQYINIAITYAILIINELISAILGII